MLALSIVVAHFHGHVLSISGWGLLILAFIAVLAAK